MEATMTFGESFASLLTSGAGLAIVLVLTLAFAATLLLSYAPGVRKFVAGMMPFVQPRDDKGNPVKRSPGQWVGMVLIIALIVVLIAI